ncbi:MAG: hypothetical protein LBF85_02830 [Tannerella sp.]|jgi:hypothetical protein|nr:hypothetical protein [Tannerella sp.]
MSKELFSREQLAKLALHTAGINAVLMEALLSLQEPNTTDVEEDIDLEIHIVEVGKMSKPTTEKRD